jgi:superfamily II DNA or RNA helicase
MSYEELIRNIENSEKLETTRQRLDEFALVIVDEAHNLRSAGTQRSEAMKTLLAGDIAKDLVMLTATPVNNSLFDLYNLISFFQTSDAAFASDGVPSLSKYFKNANAMDPDDLNPDSLFTVLEQVAVRRTRRFVKNHYAGDYIVVNGVRQTITFPTCTVNRLDYALAEDVPGIFEQLTTALAGGLNRETGDDHSHGRLRMARYTQSQYLLTGDSETYETQNAGLLRSGLLKRFESSGHAFRKTVEAMIESHEHFLAALERGWVLRGDALKEWSTSDSDDLSHLMDDDTADASPVSLYSYETLHAHVKEDLSILKSIHASAVVLDAGKDDKIEVLVKELSAIARKSAEQGVSPSDQRNRRKVIVFSYFSDTVDYIYNKLVERINKTPELHVFRDRIVRISGKDAPQHRDRLIANFAPDSVCNGAADDLYDVVVSTDVLAEGVNLQQAKHIINYDLPWNPMRLVQRHGRIDRIGSSHDEVFMHCFFPDEQLDAFLNLEEILHRKLKQAASVGVGKVLPGIDGSENVITETREIIEQLRQEESLVFESGGLGGLSGEEFRQRLSTAFQSDAVKEHVLSLPWGSGTGMKAPMNGFVFCARIGDHEQPWFRYVPCSPDFDVERDAEGNPTVVRDTISALSYTMPPTAEEPQYLSENAQNKVYDAWTAARGDILKDWLFRSDPRNTAPQIPKTMRDVAAFVRAHGHVLGAEEETLYQALQTPYSNVIQRELRTILNSTDYSTDESRVIAIRNKAEQLRLKPAPLPDPLPEIGMDDIRLVTWLALVSGDHGMPEAQRELVGDHH